MKNIYFSNIYIKESRNIRDFNIPLSQNCRKHLILTGKNGSGKTSLLNDIYKFLSLIESGVINRYLKISRTIENINKELKSKGEEEITGKRKKDYIKMQTDHATYKKILNAISLVDITFNNSDYLIENYNSGKFITAYFNAKRNTNFSRPRGITKVNMPKKYSPTDSASRNFLQHIVNLKADRSFARDEGEEETVLKIDLWFKFFENQIRELLDNEKLILEFDRKNYNFKIKEDGKVDYDLNTLSDGYSAILNIISELIMRMENHTDKSYNLNGVVLIDEIETHLHVDLQKRILPFLINFFPNIQFIVSTHSPFVLSSISNSIICDLESLIVTEDLSNYSYDAIIESFFKYDKYSEIVKKKIKNYETLIKKKNLSDLEKNKLNELIIYFKYVPKYLSKELAVKLQQIELDNLNRQ